MTIKCSVTVLASVICFALGIFLLVYQEDPRLTKQTAIPTLTRRFRQAQQVSLESVKPLDASPTRQSCNRFTCFDTLRCRTSRLKVHVPDPRQYVDKQGKVVTNWSIEYIALVEAIAKTDFYTHDPAEACVFIPPVDLLSAKHLHPDVAEIALKSSGHWNGGQNNLIFTTTSPLPLALGSAMVASAVTPRRYHRQDFDLAVPHLIPSSLNSNATTNLARVISRPWLVTAIHSESNQKLKDTLEFIRRSSPTQVRLIKCQRDPCWYHEGVNIFGESKFCLIAPDQHSKIPVQEVLMSSCIPVLVTSDLVLPFSDLLDWKGFSVEIREQDVDQIVKLLERIELNHGLDLQQKVERVAQEYFSSLQAIVNTSLEILNHRLFPHQQVQRSLGSSLSTTPLFLTHTPSKSDGFTAVVLSYDRLEQLFKVIVKLSKVPSLKKIVVVWNNQNLDPPTPDQWPRLAKPFKVIRTKANKLSNRFYPYKDIETECVFSVDDDIDMLTADELELGFQVWREFPDRLVGFPSRLHLWNNQSFQWLYESEWQSEISMILTGAAFYDNYWNFLYTAAPSRSALEVKSWVDGNMNCEDIAMNFLIANWTGKAPIKVGPRKKFRCLTPDCSNTNSMLSGIQTHMIERSDCINLFVKQFGHMPLKKVDFRVDPSLYKDNVPNTLKLFTDIGSL